MLHRLVVFRKSLLSLSQPRPVLMSIPTARLHATDGAVFTKTVTRGNWLYSAKV